jgi:type II restriction/modification system DNA methylase subunit YeeA
MMSGNIFMAYDDREWIQEGASVRVSLIGFDDGTIKSYIHNGKPASKINIDLSASAVDLTTAQLLNENKGLVFSGTKKYGPFEIEQKLALEMLNAQNTDKSYQNSDVVKLWVNGSDLVGKSRNLWIIDFGVSTSHEDVAKYELPYQYVLENVKPYRFELNEADPTKYRIRDDKLREFWWLFERTRPEMREALPLYQRYIATPVVSKFRLFIFLDIAVHPDAKVIAIARDDDYIFGVLHSKTHAVWASKKGNKHGVGNDLTYNINECFVTFPFPWPPGQEPSEAENEHVFAIAQAARHLVQFRQAWLNPPPKDIGTIIPERIIKQLTLTNLYNALTHYRDEYKNKMRDRGKWNTVVKGIITLDQIEELDYIHNELDTAVLAAYGWPHNLTDEQILERLLALNLERAAMQD